MTRSCQIRAGCLGMISDQERKTDRRGLKRRQRARQKMDERRQTSCPIAKDATCSAQAGRCTHTRGQRKTGKEAQGVLTVYIVVRVWSSVNYHYQRTVLARTNAQNSQQLQSQPAVYSLGSSPPIAFLASRINALTSALLTSRCRCRCPSSSPCPSAFFPLPCPCP